MNKKYGLQYLLITIILFLYFSGSNLAQSLPHTDLSNQGGWALNTELSDEFDADTVNTDRWFVLGVDGNYTDPSGKTHWKGRAPSQYSGNNVEVANGQLILSAKWDTAFSFVWGSLNGYAYGKDQNGRDVPITAAGIISNPSFHYGYMEIRCKAADGPISSSYWTTGPDGEMDVFEHYGENPSKPSGYKYHSSFHDWRAGSATYGKRIWTNEHYLPTRVANDFHTYAFEWNEDYLKIYYDTMLVRCVTKDEMGDAWVAYNPQRVWLDMETFNWEVAPENIYASDFPGDGRKFVIDYVRVWQQDSSNLGCSPQNNLLINGSFESNLDNWITSGAVELNTGSVQDGTQAVYLNGQGEIQQQITLAPNSRYKLSAWVKLPGTNMSNIWHNAFLGVQGTGFSKVPGELKYFHNYYYHKSLQIETGNDSTTVTIYLKNYNANHKAYIDNVELVELINSNNVIGIEEINWEKTSIYPNPATHEVFLSGEAVEEINIISVTGQVIKTAFNTNIIAVDDIDPGLYILKTSRKKMSNTTILIVQ